MPTNITESDSYTTTTAVPDDGEAADSDSLLDNFAQGFANRLNWLRQRVIASTTTTLTAVSAWTSPVLVPGGGSIPANNAWKIGIQPLMDRIELLSHRVKGGNSDTYRQPLTAFDFDSTGWVQASNVGTSGFCWQQTDVTSAKRLIFPLDLPPAGILVVCAVGWYGLGHSSMPTTKPKLRIWRQPHIETTTAVLLTEVEDFNSSASAYDDYHTVTTPAMGHSISMSSSYYAEILGEVNSTPTNLRVVNLTYTLARD